MSLGRTILVSSLLTLSVAACKTSSTGASRTKDISGAGEPPSGIPNSANCNGYANGQMVWISWSGGAQTQAPIICLGTSANVSIVSQQNGQTYTMSIDSINVDGQTGRVATAGSTGSSGGNAGGSNNGAEPSLGIPNSANCNGYANGQWVTITWSGGAQTQAQITCVASSANVSITSQQNGQTYMMPIGSINVDGQSGRIN